MDMPGILVCGVDEAGRGSLAGPIYAAAVILDARRPIEGLADSKRLPPERRWELEQEIKEKAFAYGIGTASAREIDKRGIEWANRISFTRAVRALLHSLDEEGRRAIAGRIQVKIDGTRRALRLGLPQEPVKRGDASVPEISAASILAKTGRDRFLIETLHTAYPMYGFHRHKGYATRAHLEAVSRWGFTPEHRRSFRLGGSGGG